LISYKDIKYAIDMMNKIIILTVFLPFYCLSQGQIEVQDCIGKSDFTVCKPIKNNDNDDEDFMGENRLYQCINQECIQMLNPAYQRYY